MDFYDQDNIIQKSNNHTKQEPEHQDINNHRYITNLCRNGPIPESRHSMTDYGCTIAFSLVVVCFFLFLALDFFYFLNHTASKDKFTYDPAKLPFFDKIAYFLEHNIINMAIITGVLIAFGIIFFVIVIVIPVIFGYMVIALCFGSLAFLLYLLVFTSWGRVYIQSQFDKYFSIKTSYIQLDLFRFVLTILVIIGIVALLILTLSRINKLKYLGSLMKVDSHILKKNTPFLPLIMLFFVSIFINLSIWIIMSHIVWKQIEMQYLVDKVKSQNFTIPMPVNYVLFSVFWIWIHGFQISLSDYICQSWVIHWYYNQIQSTNWRRSIFKKLFRYHLGTVIYGSLFAYFPQNLMRYIKKLAKKKKGAKTVQNEGGCFRFLVSLNQYYIIQTVMECLNLKTASNELFFLRKRIKNKIPEIYMLGHFMQDVMKILLVIIGIVCNFYLNFMDTYVINKFQADITSVQFSAIMIICGLGLFLEVASNISHLFGMLSDTAVIVYSIDCEIQRVYYGDNHARSVPKQLLKCFQPLFVGSIKVGVTQKPEEDNKTRKVDQYLGPLDNNEMRRSSMFRYQGLSNRQYSGAYGNFYAHINNPDPYSLQ